MKLQLMSTAQILEENKSYLTTELESLEDSIRLEQLRRTKRTLSARETALFKVINQPMPGVERHRQLTPLWEAGKLSKDERAEPLAIIEARSRKRAARRSRDGVGAVARCSVRDSVAPNHGSDTRTAPNKRLVPSEYTPVALQRRFFALLGLLFVRLLFVIRFVLVLILLHQPVILVAAAAFDFAFFLNFRAF